MHVSAAPRTSIPATSGAPLAALIVANIALAFGPWFVRLADVGPVASAFWRMALALPLLIALCVVTGQRARSLSPGLLAMIALGGLAFAADLGSWHAGILQTTLANATLFGNSTVLFFPIYGFLIARAWPSRGQAVALLLALAGGTLLMGRSYSVSPEHLIGDLLCLLAGVLYTIYFIVMARARATMDPLPAVAISSFASAFPLLLAAVLLGERVWPGTWGPMAGLALVSQVIGQSLMIYAIGRLSPLVVGIALLIQPIVAASVGWLVYDERLGPVELAGAVLVAVALALVRQTEPAQQLAPAAAEEE